MNIATKGTFTCCLINLKASTWHPWLEQKHEQYLHLRNSNALIFHGRFHICGSRIGHGLYRNRRISIGRMIPIILSIDDVE